MDNLYILMKPELALAFIIFALLIIQVGGWIKNNAAWLVLANVLLLLNFLAGFFLNGKGILFNGMYHTNGAIALEKNILNFGILIISLQAYNWLKKHSHLAEFYILMLCTVLGLFFMISSGNFLMFYLGLELSSIPLAGLVNFDLEKKRSGEAAIKLILSSAFASGLMLFGISLIYGLTGSIDFGALPQLITGNSLELAALVFIFAGFAFKLSAVPFHFWTADVYEGAPVPVTSFLSVISKAAAVFVFISVLVPFFASAPRAWYSVLLITIVLTVSIGNLFAIRQNNIKRFLAFSSISQVGFILLGLAPGNAMGIHSAIYFLIVYLFSNLGAFGIVALVSSQTGKEDISDYRGFSKTNPVLAWAMAISLFSLAGIPPTAGFFGKMFLITSGANAGNYLLITFAALNMVVSLYYYLKVIRSMFIDQSETPFEKIGVNFATSAAIVLCFAGVLATGFASSLYQYITNAFSI